MRRWIHSLIVALLCLTLFVDTAKACWFLRQRRHGQACRPVACQPAYPTPCCLPCEPVDTVCDTVVAEDLPVASTDEVVAHVEHTVTDTATATPPAEASVAAPHGAPAAAQESVVEHGPTIVVGPKPPADAPAKAPESVVATPVIEKPALAGN
ncbi:MAG: hypothetical protein ACKOHK_01430, partial [Planctomycetia bacterium]